MQIVVFFQRMRSTFFGSRYDLSVSLHLFGDTFDDVYAREDVSAIGSRIYDIWEFGIIGFRDNFTKNWILE